MDDDCPKGGAVCRYLHVSRGPGRGLGLRHRQGLGAALRRDLRRQPRTESAATRGTHRGAATAPTGAAALVRGRAIAPVDAPPAVKQVIAAANKIRTKPYIWGGGHGRWWDRGYDCSGAVSYALRGGEFLDSPLPSGPMERWGSAGAGRWITVYANAGHAYAVIAGLRWDTSGNTSGTGPRWHADMANSAGFVARHPPGY